MLRCFLLLGWVAAAVALDPSLAWAADGPAWPDFPGTFSRGPGYYLSTWKIIAPWVLLACWVRTTDWISQDCLQYKFNYTIWNSVVFFSFLAAFLLMWVLPWYYFSYFLLVVAYFGPLGAYIRYHNQNTEMHQHVLTKQHLRHLLATTLGKVGIKMDAERKSPHEMGPELQLQAMGGATDRDNNVNLLTARQSPGYLLARVLLDDALKKRVNAIALEYTETAVGVRFQIDGVWHNNAAQERVNGDVMLAVLKTVAALNAGERAAKQAGTFGFYTGNDKEPAKKVKYAGKLTSQGTAGGEMVLVEIVPAIVKKSPFEKLDDLGMRAKMQEQLLELLGQKSGFVLISAMPSGGLTTSFDVVLKSTDRYMRNFAAVENASNRELEIENVPATTYEGAAGETPDTVLPKLIRTYPDVLVVRELVNAETAIMLCNQAAKEGRLVISSMRAKEASEALLRVLLLKVPGPTFAPAATAVLNSRLIRKLCEKCKEAYAPPPEVLKQLGLPAGRIEAFYRPPTQPIDPKNPEKVCENCMGIGYYGRTAIFELLVVDERIRQILAKQPKLDLLRDAVRRSKQRTLQEEGVLLVARGVTSLPELMRVLKQ